MASLSGWPELMNLDTPIQYTKGIGPNRVKLFNKLGIFTVQDLLEYYPREWIFPIEDIEQRLTEIIKWKRSRNVR